MLTFTLDGEKYGIDIHQIQEIRSYEAVITHASDCSKGEINLRGNFVPIVDMRNKSRLGKAIYNKTAVVIILNVANRLTGMVVDGVSDVIKLKPEQLKLAPEFNTGLSWALSQHDSHDYPNGQPTGNDKNNFESDHQIVA